MLVTISNTLALCFSEYSLLIMVVQRFRRGIVPGDLFHASGTGLAFSSEPVAVAMKGVIDIRAATKDKPAQRSQAPNEAGRPVGEIADTAAQGLVYAQLAAGLKYAIHIQKV
jgi:hypothetical protein